MRLEWDARKARENLRKHGVSFEEARACSSILSRRQVTTRIIRSMKGVLLPLAYLRLGDFSRWHMPKEELPCILSARRTTRAERELYEEG